MKEKTKQILFTISCFLTAGLVFSAIAVQYLSVRGANMGIRTGGVGMFRMFTNDGNIFTAVVALIGGVYGIIALLRKKTARSRVIYYLRLMSAVSEFIILIIVLGVLMPMGMKFLLTGYSLFVLHAVAPLVTMASFLAFDLRPAETGKWSYLYGSLPVLVYGAIVLVLCFAKVWTGNMIPYPFFRVYDNPVWVSVASLLGIVGATVLLSYVIDKIKRKSLKTR